MKMTKQPKKGRKGFMQGRAEALAEVEAILISEIAKSHTTKSGKTSRLTSAYNRVKELQNN